MSNMFKKLIVMSATITFAAFPLASAQSNNNKPPILWTIQAIGLSPGHLDEGVILLHGDEVCVRGEGKGFAIGKASVLSINISSAEQIDLFMSKLLAQYGAPDQSDRSGDVWAFHRANAQWQISVSPLDNNEVIVMVKKQESFSNKRLNNRASGTL